MTSTYEPYEQTVITEPGRALVSITPRGDITFAEDLQVEEARYVIVKLATALNALRTASDKQTLTVKARG